MIAGDPDPFAAALQDAQGFAVGVGEPRRSAAVMEAVAQRDDAARRIMRDKTRKPRQRRGGVIGRQQHAARGKARAFFQMQVGDDEQALLRPVQRACRIGEERSGTDRDGMIRMSPREAGSARE